MPVMTMVKTITPMPIGTPMVVTPSPRQFERNGIDPLALQPDIEVRHAQRRAPLAFAVFLEPHQFDAACESQQWQGIGRCAGCLAPAVPSG